MSHKVDVIIPTYNGMPYLKDTIKSVLEQSHKDLTLYIIDDGSTDNGETEKYVLGLKDRRVKYYKKKNGGQATARNFGIRISEAPFVAMVDSDDIWDKNKLEKQLDLMNKNPRVGLVYGLCKLIDESGNVFDEVVWQKRGDLFQYLLRGNKISGSASMVLVRREALNKVGLFHEDFLIGEDWEMWLRIAKSYQIDYVPEFIANLRVLDNGMQKNYPKMAKGLDYMLPIMVREFKLNIIDRARLGKTCLKEACLLYYNGGEKAKARHIFLKSFTYNPLTFFTLNYHVWFLYLRILFGNDWLRKTRRKLSKGYREREQEFITKQMTTKKPPRVSIILPAYNAEYSIRASIESILRQTFKDFELIIVNDGSTDKTKRIIKDFDDPRIVFIDQKENKGLVNALNIGIDSATGIYIARQDADDSSQPKRIQKEVEALSKHHDLVIVGTNGNLVDMKGQNIGTQRMPNHDSAIRMSLFSSNPFIHGSVMFKADAVRQANGYTHEAWPAEDYDLWIRLMQEGRGMNIQEPLYNFTLNDDGISSNNSDKQIQKVMYVQKLAFKQSVPILRSPFTLRLAVKKEPQPNNFRRTTLLIARVSLLHLRPISFVLALTSLAMSVGAKNE